jgi:hypothetical protein
MPLARTIELQSTTPSYPKVPQGYPWVCGRTLNTDMRYKSCLSQNEHLLVLKCALALEAGEDSSFQHEQVGDARASPY